MSEADEELKSLIQGTVHPPVELFISLDSFSVSCLVLEISAVQISAFSLI